MFCPECGTKNLEDAQYCENCGSKLENTTSQNIVKKERKPLSKKSKITIGCATIILVILVVCYSILSSLTSPSKVAINYFKAVTSYDAAKIYSYMDVSTGDFTTKDMFKKVLNNELESKDKTEVVNYTVDKETISSDKMSATVTVKYLLKDKSDTETMDIKLVKEKKNKWLLFDNWKINNKSTSVVKDYNIKVLKNSKVKVEGKTLDSKYLDKKKSTDSMDVYVIPAMFNSSYKFEVELPIGIKLEDTVKVSSYSSYISSLSLNDLSDETKNTLSDAVKTSLQTLYDGVKDKKSFDDIKKTFEYKNADLSDLKSDYEALLSNIGNDYTLASITFKEISLKSLDIDSDGHLEVYVKANYDYSVTYNSGEESKTNNKSDYDYAYLTFDYVDSSYKLIDTSSLNTYFSKYF